MLAVLLYSVVYLYYFFEVSDFSFFPLCSLRERGSSLCAAQGRVRGGAPSLRCGGQEAAVTGGPGVLEQLQRVVQVTVAGPHGVAEGFCQALGRDCFLRTSIFVSSIPFPSVFQ